MSFIEQNHGMVLFLLLYIYFGIVAALALVKYCLESFAYGRMFQKAGRKFRHAFIPFVRGWKLYEIVWEVKYYILQWILMIPYIGALTLLVFAGEGENLDVYTSIIMILAFLYVGIFIVVTLVFHILFSIKVSRAFTGGVGMILGMVFFPFITTLIIGLSYYPYVGNGKSKDIHENKDMI